MINNKFKRVFGFLMVLTIFTLVLSGCSSSLDNNDSIVMIINGNKVSVSEYRYFFLMTKGGYETEGKDSEQLLEDIKKATETQLSQRYALFALAEENGITLDKEDEKHIEESLAQHEQSYGGKETFDNLLETNNLTRELYRKINIETQLIYSKLFIKLYKTQITDMINVDDYLHAKHVLVSFDETKETHEEELALATEIMEKARSGEDFNKLMEEYGEDPGMERNPNGYYFAEGEMVDEFYQGTKALEIDAISEPVETSYGYHVIQRLPLEKEALISYFEDNDRFIDLAADEVIEEFEAQIMSKAENLEIKYENIYKKIEIDTFDTANTEKQ